MSKRGDLTGYLNDHLAGSVGAIELLGRLIEKFADTPLEKFFRHLRDEIEQDRETLRSLIESTGAEESTVKNAGAWIAEKFSRVKIQLEASSEDQLGLLHALEGLVIGITGKKELWCALEAAAAANPLLRGLDYERLKKRAEEQRDLAEEKRLEVARAVFAADETETA